MAQTDLALRTGRVASRDRVEEEASRLADNPPPASMNVIHGAHPEEIYCLWWVLIPAAAAFLYTLLRSNVANAPEGPSSRTYKSVSEGQVAAEALVLFAVPSPLFSVGGRLGLGFYGSMAFAGGVSTMGYRAVQDVGAGEFSGVQAYVIDGFTGAVIGVVVPGGIRLIGNGAFRSLDWLATQGMRQSDFAITEALARRVSLSPVTADELSQMFQGRGLSGRMSEWWMNRRGFIVLYRDQEAMTESILSPIARTEGLAASEQLVQQMLGSSPSGPTNSLSADVLASALAHRDGQTWFGLVV